MKKQLFLVLTAFVASLLLSSFTVTNQETKEKNNEFVYFTKTTGWVSATESYSYSIYYQDGLDGRVYYVQPEYSHNEYWCISDNEFYNSPVCSDYRTRFRYVSNGVYFNCDLPYRAKEDNGGFIFLTQIKGWVSATDFYIYSIYYKEGAGERIYYVKPSWEEYWSVLENEYYNNPECHDYRKNFRFVSYGVYFNCDSPLLR